MARQCSCGSEVGYYDVVCGKCGSDLTDNDACPKATPETTAENPRAAAASFVGPGVFVGALLGYLLRPSIPIIGQQLPFATVITGGAGLEGLDSILKGIAQRSLGYVVIGAVLGGVVGYFAYHLKQTGALAVALQRPAPVLDSFTSASTAREEKPQFCHACGKLLPRIAEFCVGCGAKRI